MRFLNWLMALLLLMVVSACGGGGGSAGSTPFPAPTDGGSTNTAAKLEVEVSSINITSAAPATVTLTLTDAGGQPVKQTVITVSTQLGLGEFLVGTVLTDNNGVATAVLKANTAGNAGADSVSASATVGTETVTGSAGFQVAGGGTGAVATLALAISSQVITSTTPATVTFTLKDSNGAAVPQAIVSISTSRQIAVFTVPTILTDGNGVATALLQANASGIAGADAVVASAVVGTATIAGSVAYQVTGSSTTGAAPAKVELVASSNTVGSGSSPITITAVVKGANNVAIANTPVVFSADTGTLANAGTVTDSNGAATAKLSAGQNKSNRTSNVTVTAGGASGTIPIEINGTVLNLSGATTLALGTSTTLTVTASDSQGGAIAGQTIAVNSSLASVPASLTTNSSGLATLVYAPTAAGTDNVSISGIGATAQRSILVSGQDFKFTAPTPDSTINIGASGAMTVRYLVNGAVPAGSFIVQFTSTAGTFATASATTGLPLQADGTATASLSSNFAGPATVQATIFSAATPSVSVAQATVAVKFIATTAYALTLQASPSAIGPNPAGSQLQYSTIRATLLDQFKNPVANKVVNFSRVADPSGGNLSVASTPTDANGNAEVKYFSGAQSTPSGSVVLDAVVADTPAVTGQTTLTVNQSALFIALGTGNEITSVNNGTSYQKLWTAYVTDSTGAAVPRVTLTVSALPTYYLKGTFAWDGKKWSSIPYPVLTNSSADLSTKANAGQYFKCANEDTDYTGIVTVAKDSNGNGKLEPGNVISVSGGASVTTVQTDDSGFAIITLQYAESYAFWVGVDLRVSATVSGTESTNDAFFLAPGLSTDYTVETVAPAGQTSPFGVIASCTNSN